MIAEKGVANSLAVKLDTAEKARLVGELDACAGSVQAFHNELKAAGKAASVGKAVSVENAVLLDAIVRTLLPPETSD